MRSPTLPILLACLSLAIAAPAAAHHRDGHQGSGEEPPEDPCACDPVPPGPIEVVVGDGFECVGANSGYLTYDAGAVRVSVHYCKPWINDPPLLV